MAFIQSYEVRQKKNVPVNVMKADGGAEKLLHSFFTSALDVGESSTSRSGRFTPMK
jgi:hypothetical protein